MCYSWWCLSALAILGRLHWIDRDALSAFILQCQVCLMFKGVPMCLASALGADAMSRHVVEAGSDSQPYRCSGGSDLPSSM